jgi:hypothetical protein
MLRTLRICRDQSPREGHDRGGFGADADNRGLGLAWISRRSKANDMLTAFAEAVGALSPWIWRRD